MEQQFNHKINEMQNENEKLKEEKNKQIAKLVNEKNNEVAQMNGLNIGLKKKIVEVEEENRGLKEEMAKIKAYMKKKKLSIPHHVLPVELLNELFCSLPLENAFGLLAKMANGLLARNVEKMFNCIKEAMKNNKLNSSDCGPRLSISEDRLILKHSGPNRWNSVRAKLPIPVLNFVEYWNIGLIFK